MYWAMLCKGRRQVGGKKIPREVRDLIFQMVSENPTWGAPRIHGELRMLGFDVSERTISRWMPCQWRGSPGSAFFPLCPGAPKEGMVFPERLLRS